MVLLSLVVECLTKRNCRVTLFLESIEKSSNRIKEGQKKKEGRGGGWWGRKRKSINFHLHKNSLSTVFNQKYQSPLISYFPGKTSFVSQTDLNSRTHLISNSQYSSFQSIYWKECLHKLLGFQLLLPLTLSAII